MDDEFFNILRDEALDTVEAAIETEDDLEFHDVVSIAIQRVYDSLIEPLLAYQEAEGWGTHCLECGSQLQKLYEQSTAIDLLSVSLSELNSGLNEIVELCDKVEGEGLALIRARAIRAINRANNVDAVTDIHWKTRVR